MRADLERGARAETDDCVLLTGYRNRPNVDLDGTRMFASRAAWIIANGDPGNDSVLHTCHRGEEGCINIRHLYLGDQARNIRDMDEAGRGSRGHNAILTEAQVHAIRQRHIRGVNQFRPSNTEALAAEYGVCKAAITDAVARRSWKAVASDDGRRLNDELAGGVEAGPVAGAETPPR